jgi:hypothetical protein
MRPETAFWVFIAFIALYALLTPVKGTQECHRAGHNGVWVCE